MDARVLTRVQQARTQLDRGSVERAVVLLEQARAMADGDPQTLRVVLQALAEACRLAGRQEQAELLIGELNAIAPPARSDDTVPLQLAEPSGPSRRSWTTAILAGLLAVALGLIVWLWSGRYYGPTVPSGRSPGPLPAAGSHAASGQAGKPAMRASVGTKPADAGDATQAAPGAAAVSGRSIAAIDREELIRSNVGLLVHTAAYEGRVNGTSCRVEIPVASGTCFAFRRDGLMLTNRHVVELSEEAAPQDLSALMLPMLTLDSLSMFVCMGPRPSDRFEATIVHRSSRLDIAVIRIKRTFDRPLVLADSRPRVTEPVYAAGFPVAVTRALCDLNADEIRGRLNLAVARRSVSFTDWFSTDAYEPTWTRGIVSSGERLMDAGLYIQVDAAIGRGSSGGPLLSESNKVVGVCTAGVLGQESYNFALTTPQIRAELEAQLNP